MAVLISGPGGVASVRNHDQTPPEYERPGKFELAVNVKTEKALDIAIAQSLLLRADEVIR